MVSVVHVYPCPHCEQTDPVVRNGYNRGGTQKMWCKACRRTFTPHPNTERAITPEKEARIEAASTERLSQRAVARLLKVGRTTIRETLKKSHVPAL